MVDKNPEFSFEDLEDIIRANEISLSKLSPEEREAIERVDELKDKQEGFLGRPLSDEEAEKLEQSDPVAWNAIMKHGDLMGSSMLEVKGKKNKKNQ